MGPAVTGGFVTLVRGVFPEVGGQLVSGFPYPYAYTPAPYVYPNPGIVAVRPVVETFGQQVVNPYGGQQAVLNNDIGINTGIGNSGKREQQFQETRYPGAITNFPQAKPFDAQLQNQQQTPGGQQFSFFPQEFVTPKAFLPQLPQQRGKKRSKREAQSKKHTSRTENEVMDVTSEIVYVADVTEANDGTCIFSLLSSMCTNFFAIISCFQICLDSPDKAQILINVKFV